MPLSDLVQILQLSIGPVILISGFGLLLLSMNNRLGRIIDRSRVLARELPAAADGDRPRMLAQLGILTRRARIVRAGIAFTVVSVLFAAMLIIGLFLGAALRLDIGNAIAAMFVLCMLSLIAALILFLSEVNLSLRAFWLEIPDEAVQV